jgi:hypothetical protein
MREKHQNFTSSQTPSRFRISSIIIVRHHYYILAVESGWFDKVLWQQLSHLLLKCTKSGYGTVLTAACSRQGCRVGGYHHYMWDMRFSRRCQWRYCSSALWRRVYLHLQGLEDQIVVSSEKLPSTNKSTRRHNAEQRHQRKLERKRVNSKIQELRIWCNTN